MPMRCKAEGVKQSVSSRVLSGSLAQMHRAVVVAAQRQIPTFSKQISTYHVPATANE